MIYNISIQCKSIIKKVIRLHINNLRDLFIFVFYNIWHWIKFIISMMSLETVHDCSLLIYSWQVAKDRWQHGECNLFHKISVFSLLIYKKSISSTKHLLVCYCLSEEKCWADKVQKRLSYASPQYIWIFTTQHISAVTNLIHVSNNKLL